MASRHLTLRIGEGLYQRLEAQGRRERTTVSELARRLIEEGLRMEAHPGIVFRVAGDGERRPALADGPDVWVVASVLYEMEGTTDEVVVRTVELTELTPHQVRIAARYYAEYRDEMDEWLRQFNEESEQAYAEWQREQQVLQR
jgi:hypothetical protein